MLARTLRTYLGNAVSVRDFRVGLRGNRSALLLSVYLFLLIGISLMVYESSTANTTLSEAQSRLQTFYATIMGMVTFAACAIATASSATAIVMEAQRRQLELVTMTAAPPRYLLVGKLLSSFRYTWMVLILSLPVTASCVVLGGATWTSVLLSYVLISLFALLCAAVGLAVSTHASKPTGAIGWAFAGVGLYGFVSTAVSASGLFASGGRGLFSGGSTSAPFVYLLSPGAVLYPPVLDTTTELFGRDVPNILLAAGTILLVVRYLLHVGGLSIAHRDRRTIALFRFDSLATLAVASVGLGAIVGPLYGTTGFRPVGGARPDYPTGGLWAWAMVIVMMGVLPTIAAYGFDTRKLSRPDGTFRLRETFGGRPSGALAYGLLLLTVSAAAYALGFHLVGASVGREFLLTFGFVLSFVFALWAFTRNAASTFMGVAQSRTVGIAFSLLFVFGLFALFATSTSGAWTGTRETWWMLYPFRPIYEKNLPWTNLTHGGAFALTGLILLLRAESRLKRNLLNPPAPKTPKVNHAAAR